LYLLSSQHSVVNILIGKVHMQPMTQLGGNSTSAGARWLSHANFEFRLIIKNVSTDSDGTYYVLCESCWGLI